MISITNKTRYDSKFLRNVLSGALKHWQKEMKPLPNYLHNIEVTVVPARQYRGVSGYAWFNTNKMRLKIPYYSPELHHIAYNGLHFVQDLIFVFYHELMHNLGRRHLEINDKYLMRCAVESGVNLPWQFVPTKAEVLQHRPKRDLRKERYQKALKMVSKWEKKVKTSNKHLKAWQKKVKYYNKMLLKTGEQK